MQTFAQDRFWPATGVAERTGVSAPSLYGPNPAEPHLFGGFSDFGATGCLSDF